MIEWKQNVPVWDLQPSQLGEWIGYVKVSPDITDQSLYEWVLISKRAMLGINILQKKTRGSNFVF